MTVPVVASLSKRYPDDRFIVASKKRLDAMFTAMPNVEFREVDNHLDWKGVLNLWRVWRNEVDAVIDLQNVLRTRVLGSLMRLSGKRVTRVHYGRWQKHLITFWGIGKRQLPTEFERYEDAFRRAGLKTDDAFESLAVKVEAAKNVTTKYGEKEGTYDKTSLTYTDAGTYTVYYQVTCDGYEPATGSAKVVISKAKAEINFQNSSETKTYGDEKFTNTLTNSGDGTVKYSSDKTSVAVVNESSGEVEIKGVGTATITATVSGAKNYQYAKDKIAYTLTVDPKGTISDYDKKDSQDW